MEIDGEKAYPIYSFNVHWHQDGESEYEGWKKGLPKGRIWNGSQWIKMFKDEQDDITIRLYIMKQWESLANNEKHKVLNLSIPIINWTMEYETWCLTWFQHETFDVGQSDVEALDSFERYVYRHIIKAEREGKEPCLMGAEDRWRWCGSEPDGKPDDRSPAPCRCIFCKEQGVIRIGH